MSKSKHNHNIAKRAKRYRFIELGFCYELIINILVQFRYIILSINIDSFLYTDLTDKLQDN